MNIFGSDPPPTIFNPPPFTARCSDQHSPKRSTSSPPQTLSAMNHHALSVNCSRSGFSLDDQLVIPFPDVKKTAATSFPILLPLLPHHTPATSTGDSLLFFIRLKVCPWLSVSLGLGLSLMIFEFILCLSSCSRAPGHLIRFGPCPGMSVLFV